MTSSLLSAHSVKRENTSYSAKCNSGISLFNHKYSHIDDKYTLNCSKMQEKERDREYPVPGPLDSDGMVASSNDDITIRDTPWNVDVNRLIARQRCVQREQSSTYSVGKFQKSLMACKRIVTFIALFLAIVTNAIGGVININRYERKSTVGTSASLPWYECLRGYSCYCSCSILRKLLAIILGFGYELWLCVIIDANWKEKRWFKRRKGILQESRNTKDFRPVVALAWLRNLQFGNVARETFHLRSGNVARKTFLAGKCLSAYLCLFADFWSSCLCYFNIYTVNLGLNGKFKVIYDHIYLYIYSSYRSWVSCKWATYPEAILVKKNTLVYFSAKVILLMIKSYDKYQSNILIGLAHVKKAYSKNRSIFVHNRSYWRELRPLVTPLGMMYKRGH